MAVPVEQHVHEPWSSQITRRKRFDHLLDTSVGDHLGRPSPQQVLQLVPSVQCWLPVPHCHLAMVGHLRHHRLSLDLVTLATWSSRMLLAGIDLRGRFEPLDETRGSLRRGSHPTRVRPLRPKKRFFLPILRLQRKDAKICAGAFHCRKTCEEFVGRKP